RVHAIPDGLGGSVNVNVRQRRSSQGAGGSPAAMSTMRFTTIKNQNHKLFGWRNGRLPSGDRDRTPSGQARFSSPLMEGCEVAEVAAPYWSRHFCRFRRRDVVAGQSIE